MGFFDKLKKITTNLFSGFSEADEAFFEELEETLILADLGMDTALDAVEKLRTRVRKEKLQDQEAVKAALRDILAEEMDVGGTELDLSTRPAVVLFIGVNGVGKTTSIGKLAHQLKSQGKRVLLCAADTFRSAGGFHMPCRPPAHRSPPSWGAGSALPGMSGAAPGSFQHILPDALRPNRCG